MEKLSVIRVRQNSISCTKGYFQYKGTSSIDKNELCVHSFKSYLCLHLEFLRSFSWSGNLPFFQNFPHSFWCQTRIFWLLWTIFLLLFRMILPGILFKSSVRHWLSLIPLFFQSPTNIYIYTPAACILSDFKF